MFCNHVPQLIEHSESACQICLCQLNLALVWHLIWHHHLLHSLLQHYAHWKCVLPWCTTQSQAVDLQAGHSEPWVHRVHSNKVTQPWWKLHLLSPAVDNDHQEQFQVAIRCHSFVHLPHLLLMHMACGGFLVSKLLMCHLQLFNLLLQYELADNDISQSATQAFSRHLWCNQVSTSHGNSGLCWTVFARNMDTTVPAEGNGNLQTLICVLVARPRRCLTLSNPVPWQNWMAAYLGSAEEDDVSWLTSYGSWNAFEKKTAGLHN